MKTLLIVGMLALALLLGACGNREAKELFETAELEELQNNPGHARELYRRILEKHPESDFARKAREKLARMP